jgi:hypothetical protein
VRKTKSDCDWIFSAVAAVNTKTKSRAAIGGPQAWQAAKKLLGGQRAIRRARRSGCEQRTGR